MQMDKSKPVINATRGAEKDPNPFPTEVQSALESLDPGVASLPDLRKASEDLKAKISDAKRRNEMPLDSALGNPGWERSAADGHIDVPDSDDD
jgi:hypothetical protein